jgi:hypothetical protein
MEGLGDAAMTSLFIRWDLRLAFAGGLLLAWASARAQSPGPLVPASRRVATAPDRVPAAPEAAVERLAAQLGLTDPQKTQLKPILVERQDQMRAIQSDASLRPYQKLRKAQAAHQEYDRRILAILNDEQKHRYEALEAQAKEALKRRRQARKEPPAPGYPAD